jgi:hypothetical protein
MTNLRSIHAVALMLAFAGVGCAAAPGPQEEKGSTESHLDGDDDDTGSTQGSTNSVPTPPSAPETNAENSSQGDSRPFDPSPAEPTTENAPANQPNPQAPNSDRQDPSNPSFVCDPNRCGTDDGVHYWICLPDGSGKVPVRKDACVPPQR